MALQLEIVSPQKVIYSEAEVDEVIAPTTTGEIAVLPNHISLLTQLASGEITIKKGGKSFHVAVTGGFMDIKNNIVTVLADYAIRSDEIEEEKAKEAKQRAEKLMKEKTTDRDFALAQSQFKRALLELKIAGKRRHRSAPIP